VKSFQDARVGIPYFSLTGEFPPHLMPVPSQILDFQRHMSSSFLCSVSSVKVRHVSLILVDISCIDERDCLILFLFIAVRFF